MQSIKRNKLRDAIAIALVVGATGFASSSFAQEAPAAEEVKDLDTIVVTGTRIQSQSVTASSPVYEIGADEFKYAGATRVDDLVNQFPQMSPYFDSFANNGAQGYPTADLRGLGTNRTLVLINGRRIQPGNGIAPDLSMVPSALIERVDLLTGGASAVYGADAVAGVVNFVLNTEFEGVSFNAGWSGYAHDNDDAYTQSKMDARNFPYPTGNSGLGGQSENIDMVIGSTFADGAGHASAYITYRKNDAMYQSERDYTACALSATGTSCGGSGTNATGNFFVNGATAHINQLTGEWESGFGPAYNYAPPNFLQRPEDKLNFGANVKFEINEHAIPYVEMMYSDRSNEIQIAPSGTFFGQYLQLDCSSYQLGTACADLGIDPDDGLVGVYVGKRNIEGGPRHQSLSDTSYRVVAGVGGAINDNWSYDLSILYGQTDATNIGRNDFVSSRVEEALYACTALTANDPSCYNVWRPGSVTAEAAAALAGTSTSIISTGITNITGYVQGDTGLGWVDGSNIFLAVGYNWMEQTYNSDFDSISQEGGFAGAGGPSRPLSGEITVSELFMEANVPLIGEMGFIDNVALDLGYRYSDYDLSGAENTYKIALTSKMGWANFNGGYNRAIRAPNLNELFADQQIALYNGDDFCAGPTPTYTLAQCLNTGMTAAQYNGHTVAESPAGQYNQIIGGNPDLSPEQADTWTFGFDFTPIKGLAISIDYYDIKIEETISTIGAQAIFDGCALQGTASLCSLITRNPVNGNLWSGEAGYVANPRANFGNLSTSGIDLNASYAWDWLDGRWLASFVSTYVLDYYVEPLKGLDDTASYECAGIISTQCQTNEFRSITQLRYTNELYSVNARWRYISSLESADGSKVIASGGSSIPAYNLFDLSGTINVNENVTVTMGVNNIFDKTPPIVIPSLTQNGNFAGGYDAAGQYFFANLGVAF